MPFADICIYFIIAILGLAYPVALQVVARLDDKYLSRNILALFRKTNEWLAFQLSLFISLGYIVFYIAYTTGIKAPCGNTPCYDWADALLLNLTILLILTFLFYARKIFTFYVPNELIRYIRGKEENEDHEVFNCMTDLLFTAVRTGDEDLAQTVSAFIYQAFRNYRSRMTAKASPYPITYYQMVHKTIIHTVGKASKNVEFIGENAASGRWLLGTREYFKIDMLTYAWLWNNLRLIVELKEDDYVLDHWKNAHDFFDSALKSITIKTDRKTGQIINKAAVDERDQEQNQFLRFHFALGGMLLYGNMYDALKRIFHETDSYPPVFLLLPKTMSEIFNIFLFFFDAEQRMFPFPYHFTKDHNIYGEGQSKSFICKYIALLFLRQYTIGSFLYGYEPTEAPKLPNNQRDRKKWMDYMPYFKGFIQEVRQNKQLLTAIGFDHLTNAWFAEKDKPQPELMVDQVIEKVSQSYAAGKEEQEMDATKVALFKEKSVEIVNGRIASYAAILNATAIDGNYDTGIISGERSLYEKAAFAADQDVSYLSYATYLGSLVASRITHDISGMFRSKTTQRFLLRDTAIFKAIDRMKLNPAEHVIINFGIDILLVNQKIKQEGLTKTRYKGVPIITLDYINRNLIRSSLIILKKTDLPEFVYKEIDPARVAQFKLEVLSPAIYLYGQVINLTEEPQLMELFKSEKEDILKRSVYLMLELQLEVRWRKDFRMTELRLYSEFYQQGLPNDLDEIGQL